MKRADYRNILLFASLMTVIIYHIEFLYLRVTYSPIIPTAFQIPTLALLLTVGFMLVLSLKNGALNDNSLGFKLIKRKYTFILIAITSLPMVFSLYFFGIASFPALLLFLYIWFELLLMNPIEMTEDLSRCDEE